MTAFNVCSLPSSLLFLLLFEITKNKRNKDSWQAKSHHVAPTCCRYFPLGAVDKQALVFHEWSDVGRERENTGLK